MCLPGAWNVTQMGFILFGDSERARKLMEGLNDIASEYSSRYCSSGAWLLKFENF